MKIETTVNVYAYGDYEVGKFIENMRSGNAEAAAARLSYTHAALRGAEWIKVGTAKLTAEILPADAIHDSRLAALKAELEKERAESQMKQNAILDRISKLQALEYVEAA